MVWYYRVSLYLYSVVYEPFVLLTTENIPSKEQFKTKNVCILSGIYCKYKLPETIQGRVKCVLHIANTPSIRTGHQWTCVCRLIDVQPGLILGGVLSPQFYVRQFPLVISICVDCVVNTAACCRPIAFILEKWRHQTRGRKCPNKPRPHHIIIKS